MRKVEPFYALNFTLYQDLGYRVAKKEDRVQMKQSLVCLVKLGFYFMGHEEPLKY